MTATVINRKQINGAGRLNKEITKIKPANCGLLCEITFIMGTVFSTFYQCSQSELLSTAKCELIFFKAKQMKHPNVYFTYLLNNIDGRQYQNGSSRSMYQYEDWLDRARGGDY